MVENPDEVDEVPTPIHNEPPTPTSANLPKSQPSLSAPAWGGLGLQASFAAQGPEDMSFSHYEIFTHVQLSPRFKLHVLIGAVGSGFAFIVWLLISFAVRQWPWFIWTTAFFLMTITWHFYIFIRPKEILQLHATWFVIINVVIFLTWMFAVHLTAWFLYFFFGFGIFLSIHYCVVKYRDSPHKWLNIHVSFYVNTNLLCFMVYLGDARFPWFIYVLGGLAIPLIFHWIIHYYGKNWWRIHLCIFTDVQLMLFFSWAATSSYVVPWFIFPLLLWGVGLGAHWYFKPKNQIEMPTYQEEEGSDDENDDSMLKTLDDLGEPSQFVGQTFAINNTQSSSLPAETTSPSISPKGSPSPSTPADYHTTVIITQDSSTSLSINENPSNKV